MNKNIELSCGNLSIGENGHLFFGEHDTVNLAARYGTPLYVIDEDRVRHNCRVYLDAFKKHCPAGSLPLYAGKANSFKELYRIMESEGMGIDVVSSGEIFTASEAGFDMSKAYFHGNNKTDADISFALDRGVGTFVVDNEEELLALDEEAGRRFLTQEIIIRITPGIDTHTYSAVNTGKVDSKFGNAIATGQAEKITSLALRCENVKLTGFHCHVGSQVFAEDVFERAAAIMIDFCADMREKYSFTASQLNLGGGYGVRYVKEDPVIDIGEKISLVCAAIEKKCAERDFPFPSLHMEPGRSIIADAGLTLYTAGSLKKIPGYKSYVSIDGGMTDNPRYALYGSKYTCLCANKADDPCELTASLVGRCCESGDIIQENVPFPADVKRGDIIAVCTTGAYNNSMASNYNKLPRPATVVISGKESRVAIERESFADLVSKEI